MGFCFVPTKGESMLDGGDKKKVVGSCSLAATPAGKQGGTIILLNVFLPCPPDKVRECLPYERRRKSEDMDRQERICV